MKKPTKIEIREGTIKPFQFQREMLKADSMRRHADQDNAEYWTGYMLGLRRAYHGPKFIVPGGHDLWLSLVDEQDPARQQRGRGYRDGFNFRAGL